MRTAWSSTLCCLVSWLGAASAAPADDDFRLPNFNPFGRQAAESGVVSAQVGDESNGAPRRGFRFPSLPSAPTLPAPTLPTPTLPKFELPKWSWMPAANNRQGPSTWDKINGNTKSFFAKTKATLMPWTENDLPRRGSRGAGRVARRPARAGSSPNLFAPWFDNKPEPEEIRSVNDYLALPRLMPDE